MNSLKAWMVWLFLVIIALDAKRHRHNPGKRGGGVHDHGCEEVINWYSVTDLSSANTVKIQQIPARFYALIDQYTSDGNCSKLAAFLKDTTTNDIHVTVSMTVTVNLTIHLADLIGHDQVIGYYCSLFHEQQVRNEDHFQGTVAMLEYSERQPNSRCHTKPKKMVTAASKTLTYAYTAGVRAKFISRNRFHFVELSGQWLMSGHNLVYEQMLTL